MDSHFSIITPFLREFHEERKGARRTRADARRIASRSVLHAMRRRWGYTRGTELVKRNRVLLGRESSYHFDFVLGNGQPICAAQAVSLELENPRDVERDIDAAGWSIEAVRAMAPSLVTVIVAFDQMAAQADAGVAENRERLQAVADRLGAKVVFENDLEQWAVTTANSFQP